MERIFAGEVFEILIQPGALIFSYNHHVENNCIAVHYKMLSFDSRQMTDVGKNIYKLAKFGSNYRMIEPLCDNYITARALVLQGSKTFVTERSGKATLFDSDGLPIWTGELRYRGMAPSDIGLYKNSMWASYDKGNVLLRFNLSNMREELRIGGTRSPFSEPCDLFVTGNEAVVCNRGSRKLVKVNLDTYAVSDYKEFSEAVHGYVRNDNFEFVLLDSGVYLL